MKVRPTVTGSVVRFPNDRQRVLKGDGEDVPDGDMYWNRRLADRSVVLVDGDPAPTGREPTTPLTTR